LTVLVRQDRSAPVVAIVTHVRAGYFDEDDDAVGISHVLEHMFFKGTARRGPGDMARETKAAGGYLNAGTIYDHTSYYTVLPASSLERGLDVQADALLHSVVDAEELRKELRVIIQEAGRKRDDPHAVARETLFELLFDRHRMRRWRIGSEDALARYTRDDVVRFYRTFYRPSHVVLSVVGDVDVDSTFRLVERAFAGFEPAAVPPRPLLDEPPIERFRFREMTGDIVQATLEWGWRTPGTLHHDTPALDLLAIIMGQGRASRLYRQVRETGLVHAVSAHNYTPTDIGVFNISADVDAPRALAAMRAIARIVHEAAQQPPTEQEMLRAKQSLEARLLRRFETMEGQANLLADWQALGDWRLADDYYERLMALEPGDLADVAGRYLQPQQGGALLYRPRDAAPIGLDADALLEQITDAATSAPATAIASAEDAHASSFPLSPATGIIGGPELERRDDDVHIFRLDGGMRVVVLRRGSAPLVSLSLAVQGGLLGERVEEAGVTSLMARTSIKGTERYSAARLALESETLGGSISPSTGADLLEWRLSLPSSRLEKGLDLLAEAALRPRFRDAELDRERSALLSDLDQLRDDMYAFPLRLFFEGAFPGHPYGFALESVERSVATLTREDVAAWHERVVHGGEPWLFVVGNVEPVAAARAAARAFTGVRSVAGAVAAVAPVWPTGRAPSIVSLQKAQTAVVLGFPGPARDHDDVYPLQVMAVAVGGLGGRIFEELRSRRSLAYSVAAYPVTRRLAGTFLGYIATAPEREAEAREGLLEQLRLLATEPLAADEVERARRYAIGSRQIRLQTNGAALGELVPAMLMGRGVQEIREYEARVGNVSADGILDAAARWFDTQRLVEAVVRGSAASG
jgi:zinc protease